MAQDLDLRKAFRDAVFRSSAVAMALAAGASVGLGLALNGAAAGAAPTASPTPPRASPPATCSARVETHSPGDVFDRLGASMNAHAGAHRGADDRPAHRHRQPGARPAHAADPAEGARWRGPMAPDLDEEARIAAVEQAHAEADRTLATFSALLDIAQAEAGLSRETMAVVDLDALVADLAELFGPMLEDAGQTLELVLPTGPVRLRGPRAAAAPGAGQPAAQRQLLRRPGRGRWCCRWRRTAARRG